VQSAAVSSTVTSAPSRNAWHPAQTPPTEIKLICLSPLGGHLQLGKNSLTGSGCASGRACKHVLSKQTIWQRTSTWHYNLLCKHSESPPRLQMVGRARWWTSDQKLTPGGLLFGVQGTGCRVYGVKSKHVLSKRTLWQKPTWRDYRDKQHTPPGQLIAVGPLPDSSSS